MAGDAERCECINCSRAVASFSSAKLCPACGSRLRVRGNSQTLKFRLACHNCDYQSHLLSQEELEELL